MSIPIMLQLYLWEWWDLRIHQQNKFSSKQLNGACRYCIAFGSWCILIP